MSVDNLEYIREIDPQGMYAHIESLPDQLLAAWRLGRGYSLAFKKIDHVVIAGMGGSAIGADLVSAYVSPFCSVPVIAHRDYDLPGWAKGKKTLLILSSHSGNTEETLSSYSRGLANDCSMVIVTTGGKMEELGKENGIPVWKFVHSGQPRAAVGYSFGLIAAVLFQMDLIPDLSDEIANCVMKMKQKFHQLSIESPYENNPAKQLASTLKNSLVHIIGSDFLAPVARRWKGQINELAKAIAQFETLPEMDHNTMAGVVFPENLRRHIQMIFLSSSLLHPRNRLRVELTHQGFAQAGFNARIIEAEGENPLQQMWNTILLGDAVSYYLAIEYGIDPTPIDAIQRLKRDMVSK